jgi:4-amino-4-deoxy-L-arabinose transferase-like glycosyltransferase
VTTLERLLPHARDVFLILIAGWLARVAWLGYVFPDPLDGRFDDTVFYRGAANHIAAGEGYLSPFTATPTAGWPPGYPYFLAAVFKAFGEGEHQTYWANIVLMLATVVVAYAIACVLFDRRTAIVAAALLALWPGQIYFTSLTLSEPLFTMLLAAAVLVLVVLARRREQSLPLVVLFGLLCSLAILTRGQGVVLLPLALLTWLVAGHGWRRSLGWSGIALAVAVMAIAPWTIRNIRVMDSPVILSTNYGINLWIGHHEGASGSGELYGKPLPQPESSGLSVTEGEVEQSNIALREGLEYMLTHPRDELRLSVIKVRKLYESDAEALDWNAAYHADQYFPHTADTFFRYVANAYWFAALLLAGAGVWFLRHQCRSGVIALPLCVLLWTAAHMLFFAEPRFHYPVVFALALLAARAVVEAAGRFEGRSADRHEVSP